MTVIAYRNGVMAADSRITFTGEESGTAYGRCEKLFRVRDAIIGLQGESSPGLVFLDWYASGAVEAHEGLVHSDADFYALVMTSTGVYMFDKWCRGERVLDEFWAIGSGAKAALGAMHMGADAREACAIACRIDPYCALPIETMTLE